MDIKTNNVPRDLVQAWELNDKERAEFDYLDDSAELVRYRGELLPLGEFVRIVPRSRAVGFEHGVDDDSPLLKWDGIATDSYFSAHVVRYVDDGARVIVGRAYW